MPYLLAIAFGYVWQDGNDWAKWPLLAILVVVGISALREIVHRVPRPKPAGYVGKFRRSDGVTIHVARMASGKLWAASDTQPPEEIGYVDGRDLVRWEKICATPDA